MEKEKTVRLLDVAHRAGVGVGTASRVLNNEPSVGEDKRQRVMAAIAELGYRRNAIARSLKVNRTKTLGVIIPDVANEFYSEIVRGAEDAARREKYNILLCSTDGNPEKERHTVIMLSEKQVDGIIMLSYGLSPETLESLKKADVPVALISTLTEEPSFITVNISNKSAARQAAEYLIGLGHQSIAMIAGPQTDRDGGENRLAGYREALEKHGLSYDAALVERSSAYTYEEGYLCMQRILSRKRGFTAVFAASDHMAIGCIKALWDNGLQVPSDISVIGFDNLSITAYSTPPVTTVNQPRYEMGRFAAQKICRVLAGEEIDDPHLQLEHSIIRRDSTAQQG
ncbi:MAG: LacI family DNA-binding transcriptional regulator [Oscillospiraceae bacterium]|nr:LacI family DNA-binding transcriptional regulator [Oscillospiraceae bacterium]